MYVYLRESSTFRVKTTFVLIGFSIFLFPDDTEVKLPLLRWSQTSCSSTTLKSNFLFLKFTEVTLKSVFLFYTEVKLSLPQVHRSHSEISLPLLHWSQISSSWSSLKSHWNQSSCSTLKSNFLFLKLHWSHSEISLPLLHWSQMSCSSAALKSIPLPGSTSLKAHSDQCSFSPATSKSIFLFLSDTEVSLLPLPQLYTQITLRSVFLFFNFTLKSVFLLSNQLIKILNFTLKSH